MLKRLLIAGAVVLVLALGYGGCVVLGLPSRDEIQALARKNPQETAVMRQRAEEAARKGRRLRREQVWVPISRVSRNLIHAVVAAEDPKFFGHEGIDWDAVKESVEKDVRERRFVRGGSTITQQLAKNLFFSTRKSVTRKLREMIVARRLEAEIRKARILELYVNVIEWGDGVYGCEAAARRYYGKSAADLDEDEAAGLAGMIPSPRRINPQVSPRSFALAQHRVLWIMAHAGYVKRDVGSLGAEPSLPLLKRLLRVFGHGPEPEAPEEPEDAPPPEAGPTPEAVPTPEPSPLQSPPA